jgi:hypothetical protein
VQLFRIMDENSVEGEVPVMKKIVFLVIALMLVLVFVPIAAPAHEGYEGHGGGHFRAGIWIGPGWWGPWWWGPPAYPYPYYSSPPAVIQQSPPIYEEQSQQAQPYYWYFCPDSKTYYPYVKQCPSGWMKVVPPAPKGRE